MSTSSIEYNESKVTNSRFLVSLGVLLLAWGLVYQDALIGMEAIWSRSDTFAHGYFILPISLWLLWRDKTYLLASTVQATWLPIPLLAISLFVGLFAYAADINVLGQLSAVTSLIFLLWSLVGNKLAWRYKFPLAYLLFAVPMGENLIPWLQDVTAWFTVFFLKLNGIPVFVDGLYIQIPTGMFEVAVACSGIRYLIASLAVGSLYGYLTYNKTHKQLIFFIFALFLPILANGIRAYGIVAIAYYSDMKYATGADHLIYGWVFFGFIIMLMFWVGGFFADKYVLEAQGSKNVVVANRRDSINYIAASVSLTLFILTFYLVNLIPSADISQKRTDTYSNNNSSWGISFVDPLVKLQSIDENGIESFRAVFANKQIKGELISSQNALHGADSWTVVSTKELTLDGKPSMLVHLRSINGLPRSYIYQYKVGDFYTVNENKAKLMQAWNSLSRQSDASEIRAISLAEQTDLIKAEQQLTNRFIEVLFPEFDLNNILNRDADFE